MGEKKSAYKVLVGKPEERSRHRREGIIKMDFREKKMESVDWILVTQDRDQRRVLLNMAVLVSWLVT